MAGQPEQTLDEKYEELKGKIQNAINSLKKHTKTIDTSLKEKNLSLDDLHGFTDAINELIKRRNKLYQFGDDLRKNHDGQRSWTIGYPTPEMLCESITRNHLPAINRIIADAKALQEEARALVDRRISELHLSPRGFRH